MRSHSRIRRWLLPAILMFLLCVLAAQMYVRPHQRALLSWEYWRNVQKVMEVMRVVDAYYVDSDQVSYSSLSEQAIAAMLRDLDDHSVYLRKDNLEYLAQQSDQRYVGIGVEIAREEEAIVVTGVFAGSGAEDAGIVPGDRIVAVDGEDTQQDTLAEIAVRLSGAAETAVEVTVSDTENNRRSLQVMRRVVYLPSAVQTRLLKPGIGYVRLTHFGHRTAEDFDQALLQLKAESELSALVLDLRGNPGGVVTAAVEVLERFFDPGTLLLSAKGRAHWGEGVSWYSKSGGTIPAGWPVVVMVDRYSASAAEIVAGTLQGYGRGVIVGETTVGKGSIQSIYRFGNDEGFKLTTAMYYLPNERTIDNSGIEPDVAVVVEEGDPEANADDAFLNAALMAVRQSEVSTHGDS